MDIFAHAFWAMIVGKLADKKWKLKLKLWKAAFWGIFPDLFAFTLIFTILIVNSITGNGINIPDAPHPGVEPAQRASHPLFIVTSVLYSFSHSAIVFLIAFIVVWLIQDYRKKKVPWTMGGWLLHILIDIPTHSYQFYPTPFLWPISTWMFNGWSWGNKWFMIANYSLIILFFIWLWWKRKKK